MARLEDLRQAFLPLNWADKVAFIEDYRTRRYNDLNTVQAFDLAKDTKKPRATKSTKTREAKPRSKSVAITAAQKAALSPEQLDLLKQLGLG